MRTCEKCGASYAIINGLWQCPRCAKYDPKQDFMGISEKFKRKKEYEKNKKWKDVQSAERK